MQIHSNVIKQKQALTPTGRHDYYRWKESHLFPGSLLNSRQVKQKTLIISTDKLRRRVGRLLTTMEVNLKHVSLVFFYLCSTVHSKSVTYNTVCVKSHTSVFSLFFYMHFVLLFSTLPLNDQQMFCQQGRRYVELVFTHTCCL